MNRKEFVVLVIITFIVIMVWIVADITHSKAEVPIDPTLQQLLTPLIPTFDQDTFNKVKEFAVNKQKTQTKALELLKSGATLSALPTPSPIASSSAQSTSSGNFQNSLGF